MAKVTISGNLTVRHGEAGEKVNSKRLFSFPQSKKVDFENALIQVVDFKGVVKEEGVADKEGRYRLEVEAGQGPYFIKTVKGKALLKAPVGDLSKDRVVTLTPLTTAVVKVLEAKIGADLGEEGKDSSRRLEAYDFSGLLAQITLHPGGRYS